MLPATSWKADAVVRLLASVFLCIYAGALAGAALSMALTGQLGITAGVVSSVATACLVITLVLVRKPWPLERFMIRLCIAGVLFYAGILLGAWAQKLIGPSGPTVTQMVISALSFQGAALWLVSAFMREHHFNWNVGFGLGEKWREAVLIGIVAACVFLPVGWALQWLSAEAITRFMPWRGAPEEQQAVQTLRQASGGLSRAVLGVVTILLAPVAEELLFRGILLTWIRQLGFPRLALWGTSILFSLVHLNTVSFVPLLVLALVLAKLYERTGNLLAPIAAHGLFNAFNFVTLYLLQRSTP